MKKQNIKNNKGITLIALIITIIILLILAMVSIRLLINGGIITHAENATNQYEIAQEKEKIALGYSEYKMSKYTGENSELRVDGATVTENGQNGWTVEFESGNSYDLNVDGEISAVEPYVPVVNPTPTEWTIAYAYDGTNWTKYTEDDQVVGGSAEGGVIQGQIIAKFYQKNVPVEGGTAMLPSGTIPAPAKEYSYELYIEGTGTGQMPGILDLSTGTGYGYMGGFAESIQNNNVGNELIPYVTEIKVCEGVTNIGGFAFANAINLEKVQIAKTVKTIDTYAFLNCLKLSEITIPYGVETIGTYAFQCSGITNLIIPDSVTTIGMNAFQYSKLKNVTLSKKLEIIEANTFHNTELITVTIPSNIRKIDYRAFGDCSMLKEVYIYTETCEFGYHTFEGIYVDIYYASRRKS